MSIKKGLLYSLEHDWINVDGDKAFIGITDYAQESLGDIVFIELPEIGLEIAIGDSIAVIESVKAAATVFSPVSGRIIAINEELEESPELLNDDPYGNHIVVLEFNDQNEFEQLKNASEYLAFCQALEEGGES